MTPPPKIYLHLNTTECIPYRSKQHRLQLSTPVSVTNSPFSSLHAQEDLKVRLIMKNTTYQSLCLEGALKSPLHFRHGAVIILGGEAIGQGHIKYRTGLSTGTSRAGRISSKTKDKHERKPHSNSPARFPPLSVHAEMAAIYSKRRMWEDKYPRLHGADLYVARLSNTPMPSSVTHADSTVPE